MKAKLTGPESPWNVHLESESKLTQLLHSELFKDKNAFKVYEISTERIKLFGLLTCTGTIRSKIDCFTEIIQRGYKDVTIID